jgi:tetratricopeptide (TPR) repeat protein
MQSKCDEVEIDLGRLIAGDEERIENRERLYNHLVECADCRQRLKDSKEFLQLLQAKQKPPTHFRLKIEQLLKEPKPIPGTESKQQIDATPLVEQGRDLIKKGDYQSALKSFDEALLLDPSNLRAQNYKTDIENLLKNKEELSKLQEEIRQSLNEFQRGFQVTSDETVLKVREELKRALDAHKNYISENGKYLGEIQKKLKALRDLGDENSKSFSEIEEKLKRLKVLFNETVLSK